MDNKNNTTRDQPPAFHFMVTEVSRWLDLRELDEQRQFASMSEPELIRLHHSLGQVIRNEFSLWAYEHTPELVGGIDVSPHHPDAISEAVIKQVWLSKQS